MVSHPLGFQFGLAKEETWQKIRRREESTLRLFIPLGSLSKALLWAIYVAETNVAVPLQ